MAGPLLNTCCGCQSLRSGSIISGILAIILSIISLIAIFVSRIEFKTFLLNWLPSNVVKIILAVNLCMTILITILMIVGVLKRNHYIMIPWVVLGIMIAVSVFVSVIYTSVVLLIDGFVLHGCIFLIVGLIAAVILTYCWCVVYSQFVILSEESKRGQYGKQPYRR